MITFFLLTLHWLITIFFAIRIVYRKYPVGTSLAWLSILFFLPIFGIMLYLLIGERRIGIKRQEKVNEISQFYLNFFNRQLPRHLLDKINKDYNSKTAYDFIADLNDDIKNISYAATAGSIFHPFKGNHLQILNTADDILDSMISDINQAQTSCVIEFYIIYPKGKVEQLLLALIDAAKRGVHCAIVADSVGSAIFFKSEWNNRLKESGVGIVNALPVNIIKSFFIRSDLRNHRKIMVIDASIAYTGSFNLVDPKQFKQDAGVGEWIDIMARCKGPIVQSLAAIFYADYFIEQDKKLEDEIINVYTKNPGFLNIEEEGDMQAQAIASGPDQINHNIYSTVVALIHHAKQNITITTPYFVPDDALFLALIHAARRGVRVTIIVPHKVDSLLVHFASRSYFLELLEAGVEIAQFYGGLLHTKTILIDNSYVLFGTVNMDIRSFYLNLEISLLIFDENFAYQLSLIQHNYLSQSHYIEPHKWSKRSKITIFIENIFRLASPLL